VDGGWRETGCFWEEEVDGFRSWEGLGERFIEADWMVEAISRGRLEEAMMAVRFCGWRGIRAGVERCWLTRFTRFMGELCRAESSSELQPHLSSSTRIFLRNYAIFTITFDAYQLFLINKQLISLGRQVVRSKRILTVLLDERRGEYEVRTVGTRPR
jgi:hypothetical protein